ncbi:hypothetical protein LQZ18_02250 [Lachnospiraceae bacterium ZAX-1]
MLLLKANPQLKEIFSRLIKTMDVSITWNEVFLILNNSLILPGEARSLIFNYEDKKAYTNILELSLENKKIEQLPENLLLTSLLNMTLYTFSKWDAVKGVKVDKSYAQLNILFQSILKGIRIDPAFSEVNFRFYQKGIQITYEEVICAALEFAKEEEQKTADLKENNKEMDEEEQLGLWHKIRWEKEKCIFKKQGAEENPTEKSRIGNNFYMVNYICPNCQEKIHMTVYPSDIDVLIETVEGRVYITRAYACDTCNCFYTPIPGKLLQEGDIYSQKFVDDRTAYEDYLEHLGRKGVKINSYRLNRYEKEPNQKAESEAEETAETLEAKNEAEKTVEKAGNGSLNEETIEKAKSGNLNEERAGAANLTSQRSSIGDNGVFHHAKTSHDETNDEGKRDTGYVGKGANYTRNRETEGAKNYERRSARDKEEERYIGERKAGKDIAWETNRKSQELDTGKENRMDSAKGQGADKNLYVGRNGRDIQETDHWKGQRFAGKSAKTEATFFDRADVAGGTTSTPQHLAVAKEESDEKLKMQYNAKIKKIGSMSRKQLADLKREIENAECFTKNEVDSYIRRIDKAFFEHEENELKRPLEAGKSKTYEIEGRKEEPFTKDMPPRKGHKQYADMNQQQAEQQKDIDEKEEIENLVKHANKKDRKALGDLYDKLKMQDFSTENKTPYLEKIHEKIYEMDEKAIEALLPSAQASFEEVFAAFENISAGMFLPELKQDRLEMLRRRLARIKMDENRQLVRKLKNEMERKVKDFSRLFFYEENQSKDETATINYALDSYAATRNEFEFPLLICDSSRKENGKKGFVLTPDHIYYRDFMETAVIRILDIEELEYEEGKIKKGIYMKMPAGEKIKLPNGIKQRERQDFTEVLNEFVDYLKEKPDSRKLEYLAKEKHEVKCCYRCGYTYKGGIVCPKCGNKLNN